MFFDDSYSIFKILAVGTLAYVYLILLLRISGKRTLSQMNAFDFIVTVAFGSTLATVLISKDVVFFEGVAALTLLVFLQYVVAFLSSRIKFINNLVKSDPQIIFYKGSFNDDILKSLRVSKEEVFQAMRSSGTLYINQVEAIVLETNGEFSVVKKTNDTGATTLPKS